MVSMEQAVNSARTFLTKYAGLSDLYLKLDELKLEGKTWVIKFHYTVLFAPSEPYIVEVDDERGDVISFKRPQR